MAKKKNGRAGMNADLSYDAFVADLKAGTPKRLYAFFGEEKFLLESGLSEFRKLIPQGTEEFNHNRMNAESFSASALENALNMLPAFSEFTLTEVADIDFTQLDRNTKTQLTEILSDIPEYACVVFVFDTVEYKLDGRVKEDVALKKLFTPVQFPYQSIEKLSKWVGERFRKQNKVISRRTSEKLAAMTGFSMTAMNMEIEKLASFSDSDEVTDSDLEALVVPVPDAVIYELTDALLIGDDNKALSKLSGLCRLGEPPQKIIYGIASKFRQLAAAKVYLESGNGMQELMELCGIKYSFQAKNIISSARRCTLEQCVRFLQICSDTAYKLNSARQDDTELLLELMVRLSNIRGFAK